MTGSGLGGIVIALVPTESLSFVQRKVRQAFADDQIVEPDMFVVSPSGGAQRVY
jgi:galactokinase